MNTMLRRLLAAAALCTGALIQAQAQAQATYVPTIPPDDSLYQALGGQPGLIRLMDTLVERLLADPRTHTFFADAELPKLKEALVVQFCEVSGGPCRRDPKAKSMRQVHYAQDVTKADFNAVVEVLQQAMDAQGIGFSAQNRLLAQLAPMHREIINKP